MGRNNKRGNRKGGGGAFRKGPRDAPGGAREGGTVPYRSYPEIIKENERLERYYNTIIPFDDEERTQFWDALKRELPNSFRFCGSKGHALAVQRLLGSRYIPEIVKIERYDGQLVEPPRPISWYPDGLAYSMNTPKQVIRKFPPFAAFQKFLVSETSVGNISRQEIVSMIPPLLMDIVPGMKVLDMCAAPGSKAAQLLEMLHVGEEARIRKVMGSFGSAQTEPEEDEAASLDVDSGDDGRATGLLVANDADYKRSHLLVHQLKRLASPNLVVTNHDATLYPAIRLPKGSHDSDKITYLKFDRILADVPCSGDGTLRKNMNLWKDWNPGNALGLHITQVRILVRALQLLKVGGRVVYSTCSMNPVENESIIVSAIERCGGPAKIDIVDCSDRLAGLKRVPGMHQWQVMDKVGRMWSSWEEVQQYALTKEDGLIPGKVSETMFPRPDGSDCSGLPLDRCMRVYGHQQDTGGFFITVLEKKGEVKAKPEKVTANPEVKATDGTSGQAAEEEVAAKLDIEESKAAAGEPTDILPVSGAKRPRDEDDVEVVPEVKKAKTESIADDDAAAKVEAPAKPPAPVTTQSEFKTEMNGSTPKSGPVHNLERRNRGPDGQYEEPFKYLSPEHEVITDIQNFYKISPRFPSNRYMVRNALGEPAKAIYYTSKLLRDIFVENEGRGIKFVHGGVKMFMKQDAPSAEVCRWRIQSEGIGMIEGYIGPDRAITLTNKDTFHKLLKEMFPRFDDGDWVNLNEIGEQARDIGMGCCVLKIEPDGSDPDFSERMVLPLWKSFKSLNLMLPKEDRSAMLLRLFNDNTPVINQTLKEKAKQDAAKAERESKAAGVEEGDAAEEVAAPEAAETEENGEPNDDAVMVEAVEDDQPNT